MPTYRSIFYLITLSLLISGCSTNLPASKQAQSRTQSSTKAASIAASVTRPEEMTADERQKLLNFYKTNYFDKKIIPQSEYKSISHQSQSDYYLYFYTYDRDDCIGYRQARTEGGDLITTLINDSETYQKVSTLPAFTTNRQQTTHLTIYTPEYLKNLSEKIQNFARTRYGRDIYTYYFCREGNTDIVAGSLWSASTSPYYFNEYQGVRAEEAFARSSTIILAVQGKTIHAYRGLPAIGDTGTGGGDVYPCGTSAAQGHLTWRCYGGTHECTSNTTVSKDYAWTLFEDGSYSRPKTIFYPTCEEVKKL